MSIYKIENNLRISQNYLDKLGDKFNETTKLFKKYYRGDEDFSVSMVAGDGLIIVHEANNMDTSTAGASTILQTIKNKGYFDDDDLESCSF